MGRIRRQAILMAAILVGMLLVSGLAALAQEPVILGLGLLVPADSPAGRGAQLALAQINSAGGVTGPDGVTYAFELLSVPVTSADEVRAALQALRERQIVALLGPDQDALVLSTFNDLRGLRLPVLTAATGDSITIADTSDTIFRSRSPEQVYTEALVAYLTETLDEPVLVTVQVEASATTTESIASFTAGLGQRGVAPLSALQIDDPEHLEAILATLINLQPDVVCLWGAPGVAVELLQQLRDAGWSGIYVYRNAADVAFRDLLLERPGLVDRGPVLGVTNWTPGVHGAQSDAFLSSYAETFSSVPDSMSAAYYDAVYLLAAAVAQGGGQPAAIQQGLQRVNDLAGVQGTLDPSRFVVGETISFAVVVQLNSYAAPQAQARLVDGELLAMPGQTSAIVLSTPQPTAIAATPTPDYTPTPQGVWGQVNSARLNVRTGPGTNYPVIGQLSANEVVSPLGANVDFSWLVIPFRGQTGWVATYLVDIMGGSLNTLPIVIPPPSPTPALTATPTPAPFADLVVTGVSLDPLRPIPGRALNVWVVIQNMGNSNSVETAVAATFQPGEMYTSAAIPALAPGQSVTLTLSPILTGAGSYSVQLVVDLNGLVNEGTAGEANNLYPVSYTFDHPLQMEDTRTLNPGQELDLIGSGVNQLRWDGTNLLGINGAQVVLLPGLTWTTVYYDVLPLMSGTAVARASLTPGPIIGLTTSEGLRGYLRVNSLSGDALSLTYRVYQP